MSTETARHMAILASLFMIGIRLERMLQELRFQAAS
jgi:hypothetical protein